MQTVEYQETTNLTIQIETLKQLLEIHEQQAQNYVEKIEAQQEEIEHRSQELCRINEKLQITTDFLEKIHRAMPCGLIVVSPKAVIESVNDSMLTLLGYQREDLIGAPLSMIFAEEDSLPSLDLESQNDELTDVREEKNCVTRAGTAIPVLFSSSALSGTVGTRNKKHGLVCIMLDIRDRKQLELDLRHAQKMESVGRLAAGIAHEINTPAQFVGDNINFVKESFRTLCQSIDLYGELLAIAKSSGVDPQIIERVERAAADNELDFLLKEIPQAIDQAVDGVSGIAKIVQAMKEFSHPGKKEKNLADLNKAIQNAALISRAEWKYVADLDLDLDPNLPHVNCFLGEINQTLLNLIINAAHAIGDVVRVSPGQKGIIKISTRRLDSQIEINVSDTGTGIPEDIQSKIFDPFFTTKEVGKGSGQGLSIVYGTIVKRHGGSITCQSKVGFGTTFSLLLPA